MTFRVTPNCCLRIVVSIALAGEALCRAGGVDPSDMTQSSYATPVRGDVIQWSAMRSSPRVDVTFEEGSAVVRPSVRSALIAANVRQGGGSRIEIVGRTDSTGKPALGLARGLNELWNKGGLQYAPPIR